MSAAEPDDPGRNGRSDEGRGTNAAFAEIVAGLRADADLPSWPDDERAPEVTENPEQTDEVESDPADEDHYQPPEPPPLPVLRARTVAGLVVLAIGTFLLIAPGVLGVSVSTSRLLGILVVAGGIGWLLMGLRDGPPADSGWDDGARL